MSRTTQHAGGPTRSQPRRTRVALFIALVVLVLAGGGYLAFGKLINRPAAGGSGTALTVQSSMAGFTPEELRVKAGSTVALTWWTNDSALHLQGGVHTMIAPQLGLNEALPANSKRTFTWAVPHTPGTYDVYCDTCCGGKASPGMHGTIVIEPTA